MTLFAELSLRGWVPLWAAVGVGLLAAAAVALLYAREAGRLGPLVRLGMASVRLAAVALLAFLLLRPVWVKEEHGERRRPVAVLVDASQSMDSKDPRPSTPDQWRAAVAFGLVPADKWTPDVPVSAALGGRELPDKPSRIEVARAALTDPKLDLFERLKATAGPLEVSTFGSRRTGRETADLSWLKTLTGTEPRTALADAVGELVGRDPSDLPAAVVIATDGRENASRQGLADLAKECERLRVPLHVYGVGSSAFGQVQVRDAAVPEALFVDDTVSVPVRFRVAGVPNGRAEIVLTYGDREVARKVLDPVREGDDLREVLQFVPTKADAAAAKQELTARITVTAGGETLADELTKPAKVIDRKLKVLVVDSLPRYDFRFLQRALLRDRRVEARFHLTEADRATLKSGPPWVPSFPIGRDEFRVELFGYDLLILGDVPGTFWTADQQEVIREFVAEGGGLIHIAGRAHAPAGWVKSPIADLLPVEVEAVRFPVEAVRRPTPFRPRVVPAAARSALLSLEDDPEANARRWRELPPLYWHYPVLRLKPGAEAFLAHPDQKGADGKPMPLVAGHYYGKGYALFLAVDETWRWRYNQADKFFGRFWSQAVYAAGVPRTAGTKLTQLALDATDPIQGKTGQVFARLFTKEYKPVTADEVEGRLTRVGAGVDDPAAVPVKLTAVRGPDNVPTGEYVGTLPFDRAGRFALTVQTDREDPSTRAALDYRVTLPPEHELAAGPMAEAELRRLAEASGGAFYREEDLYKLPEAVKPQTVPVVTRTETVLWNRWAMIVLVSLLTLEWVARKLNGLS